MRRPYADSMLSRDGWIASSNQRGYTVLGPRIPWISRLRLLSDEPWTLTIDDVREDVAPDDVAEALRAFRRQAVAGRELGAGDPGGDRLAHFAVPERGALEISPGAPVVVRESHMRATASGKRWSVGASYYPAESCRSSSAARDR
jgi:hypothetical protein